MHITDDVVSSVSTKVVLWLGTGGAPASNAKERIRATTRRKFFIMPPIISI
ncbi:conserved hypothetical protein [Wolbachia endosymbiont of Drosophila ananassae]|nr:conserved hypothetical protein [Wolbachia endosymbiont of Drosophila ananassae]